MHARPDRFLVTGAALSALAALAHLGIIVGGPEWYRFFGAGEAFAQLDAQGSLYPDTVTFGIASVLAVWAAYALSGAGVIRRLPLLRSALSIITAVYLLRGLGVLPLAVMRPESANAFAWWSSAICMGYGWVHLVGLRRAWPRLSAPARPALMEAAR